jgi:predicted flap endonuclease-1-like 5' DNA nuclease
MSIIDTIVSALRSLTGGGSKESTTASGSSGSRSEGQVSVEHEPDASTEAAVKGGADTEAADDAAAAGTDASASTGTLVDEDAGREPAETVGEAGGVDVDETADEGGVGSDEDDADEVDEAEAPDGDDDSETDKPDGDDDSETAEAGDEDADGSAESVEVIKGIGPAYAGRLEEFGIETVGELAVADAAEVAEGIDVSESRVSDWIDRANDAS